jgi:Asp-tRNA(Asn)/Glu-tRNA(Gln) amidotransferase A subunit family amidase
MLTHFGQELFARLTAYVLGGHVVFGTSDQAAVSGYPATCINVGLVHGLPVGLTFMGPAWRESRLLVLAFAFEQGLTSRICIYNAEPASRITGGQPRRH